MNILTNDLTQDTTDYKLYLNRVTAICGSVCTGKTILARQLITLLKPHISTTIVVNELEGCNQSYSDMDVIVKKTFTVEDFVNIYKNRNENENLLFVFDDFEINRLFHSYKVLDVFYNTRLYNTTFILIQH